jgi:rubrerythrin
MFDEADASGDAVQSEGESPARAADAWKRRDRKARMLAFMVRCRSRLPGWHEEALGVLAAAEADGVRVLEAALPAIIDPKLRRVYLKHIEDERRHTRGFADLYHEHFPQRGIAARPRAASRFKLVDFFAFLEITEVRGEQMIQNYHGLYARYPKAQAFMATVLRDERYHANYLHAQLQSWAEQGMAQEVAAARRAAARVDARGFRIQLLQFALSVPRLLWNELSRLALRGR